MELGSIFFLMAIIIVVILVITQPFNRKYDNGDTVSVHSLAVDSHEADYRAALRNIRELTNDFELGKLSETDYASQKKLLEDQAVRLMQPQNGSGNPSASAQDDPRASAIEQLINSRRMEREEQTVGFCPKCGKPVQKSDQFCPSCGEPRHLYL